MAWWSLLGMLENCQSQCFGSLPCARDPVYHMSRCPLSKNCFEYSPLNKLSPSKKRKTANLRTAKLSVFIFFLRSENTVVIWGGNWETQIL